MHILLPSLLPSLMCTCIHGQDSEAYYTLQKRSMKHHIHTLLQVLLGQLTFSRHYRLLVSSCQIPDFVSLSHVMRTSLC